MKNSLNNNRGYCDYVIDSFGKKRLLRSSNEYVIYKWLLSKNLLFSIECQIYSIDEKNYKPDFFIFKKGKIKQIIEVKHHPFEVEEYLEKYYDFFKNMGIKYKVLGFRHITKIIKSMELEEGVKEYKLNAINNKSVGYKGKENPMYNNKHTEKSKKKNGEKTKIRMNDIEWKEKWLESVNEKVHSDEYRKNFLEGIRRRTEKYREENYEERKCPFCKKKMVVRKDAHKWKCCSQKCGAQIVKYRRSIGDLNQIKGNIYQNDESKKRQMVNIVTNYLSSMNDCPSFKSFKDVQMFLEDKRKNKLYPNNKPSKEEFFNKYFKNVDELNNIIKEKKYENKEN